MDRLELLKNLLVMAAADGSFSAAEFDLLATRSARWGIGDEQFAEAIEYALSADARLTIPDQQNEREELLQSLIQVIGADGDVADVEQRLFSVAAAKMGLEQIVIAAICK